MQPPVLLPGDVVWIRQRRWRVERARREGNVVRLDVASASERVTFLTPFDRPVAAGRSRSPRRARRQRALAHLAQLLARTHGWSSLPQAAAAGIDVLPHQLEPALALLRGARRVLVADEVGLGKTIQAGIVIAETIARDPASRVMVIVPGALREQWIRELSTRFRIDGMAADRRSLDDLARAGAFGESPWNRPGVWIGSLDFLKQRHVLESLPVRAWDLVVVDEAHGACGDSDRHEACDRIARQARRVLLLTATPHSGDEERFTRLLEIGTLASQCDPPLIFRRTRAGLGLSATRSVRWHRVGWSEAETRALNALDAYEASVLRAAGRTRREQALLLLSVFRKRALSTMAALAASVGRRLAWIGGPVDVEVLQWRQPQLSFDDLIDDAEGAEREALMSDVGMAVQQERSWLRRLRLLAEAAASRESKAERVARLIERAREPVVVFTEFRDSLHVLEQRLTGVTAVATLHGGLTDSERARQLARFLHGAARVLLTTDVAGQGLNLQSRARWVVSLELPWNPVRLEQRIGRVDRIGQRRPVHFTLLVGRDARESGLLSHLARRVLTAQRALGDDVLVTVAPHESALAAVLLERTSADEGWALAAAESRVAVPLCRRWRRPAVVVARRLAQSRLLEARWRAPTAPASPLRAQLRRVPALRARADEAVLVFAVPLIGRGGDVVERHVVALRVADWSAAPAHRAELIAAAREVATSALKARAARLTRRFSVTLQRDASLEVSVAEGLMLAAGPVQVQAGLFDRARQRVFEIARDERRALELEARRQVERRADAALVDVARPTLEIVWQP